MFIYDNLYSKLASYIASITDRLANVIYWYEPTKKQTRKMN